MLSAAVVIGAQRVKVQGKHFQFSFSSPFSMEADSERKQNALKQNWGSNFLPSFWKGFSVQGSKQGVIKVVSFV